MTRLRISLPVAILSALSMVLIASWLLLSFISFKITKKEFFDQKADVGRQLLTTFVSLLPPSIEQTAVTPAVQQFVAALSRERIFESIVIIDRQGNIVYATPSSSATDRVLSETVHKGPSFVISADQQHISRYDLASPRGAVQGAVRLTLSLADEHERFHRLQNIFFTYFALDFFLLLAFGSLLLSRFIVVPIRKLLTATEQIAKGDFTHLVPVAGTTETADLAQSFNSMITSLDQQRREIEHHVISLETANDELKQAREETVRSEKMASVGLLAAGMAHEVGTPLSAIMGYAAMLREELRQEPELLEYVQRIEDDSRRIDRIVRHLLDYARPRPGDFALVNPGELLRGAYELLATQGIFKRLNVSISFPDNLPQIRIDSHQLQQVLINLMINARDAMPSGGNLTITASSSEFLPPSYPRGATVAVCGRRKSDFKGVFRNSLRSGEHPIPCLRIEVLDTGEGIPPDHLEKLFDPFFTTKEPGKGTGLGLAICARIIDSFNGRITVTSSVGAGTSFIIWLPLEKE